MSGSSAQDNALERLFRLQCEEDTLDIYRAGGNQRVLFCLIRSRLPGSQRGVAGFPAGKKVAFHKSSVGGSGYGVGPVIQETRLQFINMGDPRRNADQRCPQSERTRVPASPPFDGYMEHNCSNPNPLSAIPDAGVSDVEPRIFAENFGFPSGLIERRNVRSAYAVIFGIPVSLNLRNALQAARFKTDSPCHPGNAAYADNAESEACMPGLTRAQLAWIFAGTV